MGEHDHAVDLISFEDTPDIVQQPLPVYSPNRPLSAVLEEPASARSSRAIQTPTSAGIFSPASVTTENDPLSSKPIRPPAVEGLRAAASDDTETSYFTAPESARFFDSKRFGALENSLEPVQEKPSKKAKSITIIYRRFHPALLAVAVGLFVLLIIMVALLLHFFLKSKHHKPPSEGADTTTNAPASSFSTTTAPITTTHQANAKGTRTTVQTITVPNTKSIETEVVTIVTHTTSQWWDNTIVTSTKTMQVVSTPSWITSIIPVESTVGVQSTVLASPAADTPENTASTTPTSSFTTSSSTAESSPSTSLTSSTASSTSSVATADAAVKGLGHGFFGVDGSSPSKENTGQVGASGNPDSDTKPANMTISPVRRRRTPGVDFMSTAAPRAQVEIQRR